MADWIWKGMYCQCFGAPINFCYIGFLDTKEEGGGDKNIRKENIDGNSGHYIVASQPPNGDRLQRRRLFQLKHITFNC